MATGSRFRFAAGCGLLLAVVAGCDRGSLPPQANPDEAREALRSALETWQKRESIDDLTRRTPRVYFNDPKCRSDVQLLDFKLDDGHTFHGQSVRVGAVLSLKFPDGTTKERKTAYLVDTTPAVVIVPE
jgi:hypothetical protein